MNWTDASEIVCGLVLEGKLSVNAVRPEIFMPPYDQIIKIIKVEPVWDISGMIERVGLNPVQSAVDSIREINLSKPADWVRILEESFSKYDAGVKLEKVSRRLKKGEDVDWGQVQVIGKRAQEKLAQGIVGLDEVDGEGVSFTQLGWPPVDEHLGGIPSVGVVTVGAPPGTGKTTLMLKLAEKFVKHHPDKTVFIATLEMVKEELKERIMGIAKLTKEQQSRIKLADTIFGVNEIYNAAATIPNLGMIMIDFVDLMVSGENTESSMANIYRSAMIGSKSLRVPTILLSQMNRAGQATGIPKPSALRYSGMAEALSWMIWMLYNPAKSWQDNDEETSILPVLDNTGYIIVWKVRGGFKFHEDDSPGAIAVPFKGSKGWGDKSRWFSLQKYS